MRAAERDLRALGYTNNLTVMSESVYGTRGEYAATIRPIGGKGLVFFIVAGPDSKECDQRRIRVSDKFGAQ